MNFPCMLQENCSLDASIMRFVFFRSIRRSSGPILSQRSFILAVSWIVLFCEKSKLSVYAFDFPLGSIFKGNQTVLSENATFEVGLFSPFRSDLIYLGIWYAAINPRTVVWVANRNKPVSGAASYGCSTHGELQLRDSRGTVVWSSETKGRNVSGGIFKSSGNIVLLGQSASTIVWQSFDYPTNTWLPNMKMQRGKKLVSWKSASDPSEGPYSYALLQSGEFVAMWKNRKQYWTTGTWNGSQFSNFPFTINSSGFQFFDDASGFWWSIIQPKFSRVAQIVIDSNGMIRDVYWKSELSGWNLLLYLPSVQCEIYGVCGQNGVCRDDVSPFCSCPPGFEPANDDEWSSNIWFSGCSLKQKLNCSGGQVSGDKFVALEHTSFDAGWRQLTELDLNESLEVCLRNCSCEAFSYGSGENCELLGAGLLNGWTSATTLETVYIKVAGTPFAGVMVGLSSGRRKDIRKWVARVCIAAALFVVGAACAYAVIRRSRKKWPMVTAVIKCFTYAQLQAGTRNFSERLGNGGFGVVFRGSLPGEGGEDASSAIAVKQLHPEMHRQGEKQFRMEVATIGTIQHVNLVRLRGFCTEKSHRLLVYDFMPNGSLDAYLISAKTPPPTPNSTDSRKLLDWAARYNIALGTARGIAYLHDDCRQCIIHCDIKPENILLDAEFSPKVADFGLAKFVGREFSRALTTIRGTRGYLAPEWFAGMAITPKADVYSFGMTVLELVSGRRNTEHKSELSIADLTSSGSTAAADSASTSDMADPHRRFFPVWAALCTQEGKDLTRLLDRRLRGKVDCEEVRRVVYTAVWCIQDHEISRPTMRHVVNILEGSIDVKPPPMPESLLALVLEEDPLSRPPYKLDGQIDTSLTPF